MPEAIVIEKLARKHLIPATQVLKRSFPWQNFLPLGRLSLLFYFLNQCYPLGLSRCLGIEDTRFWVAVSATTQRVLGIIGLYSKTTDATESNWLDWFCVAPVARGQGIGEQLLLFSIEQAQQSGKQFMRIITSDDSNENIARTLYEKHGFRLISTSQPWYWRPFKIRMLCLERKL